MGFKMKLILNTLSRGKKSLNPKDIISAVKYLNYFVDTLHITSSDMDYGFGDLYIKNHKIATISYNGMIIEMEKRLK